MAKRGQKAKTEKPKRPNGRPPKYTDVEVMQERIDAYFAECDEKEQPYTITGLALALDMDRDSLLNYEKEDKFFGTIKKAKLKCQNFAEKRLFGGGQVAGVIFNLINNYSWKNKVDVGADVKSDGKLNIQVEFV